MLKSHEFFGFSSERFRFLCQLSGNAQGLTSLTPGSSFRFSYIVVVVIVVPFCCNSNGYPTPHQGDKRVLIPTIIRGCVEPSDSESFSFPYTSSDLILCSNPLRNCHAANNLSTLECIRKTNGSRK